MMEAIFGPFLGHFSWISEENIKEMGGGVLGGGHEGVPPGLRGGPTPPLNDSSIGVFSKMPRFLKIFARRRRRHKNGRCDSLLENRRFPTVSWFFMGLGSFEGCQSKKS